ncbi:MAG TPA: DUF2238 domain-containing protein [Thiotrichales bacterium]|nr:DUF2238 domain-containing protein [Thiotrichales bacterium]
MNFPLPRLLLLLYLLLFTACAISPYNRAVWWAENIPILLLVAVIAVASRFHRFSPLSWLFMSVLVALHTIGGHYTFERVPFGFVSELFGFTRNHYDRIAHFSVGFYALPIAEMVWSRRWVTSRVLVSIFAVSTILAVAALYEIFEWRYALLADPGAGIAVLGSQGDPWDAQKDMLADGLGALFSITGFLLWSRRQTAS